MNARIGALHLAEAQHCIRLRPTCRPFASTGNEWEV